MENVHRNTEKIRNHRKISLGNKTQLNVFSVHSALFGVRPVSWICERGNPCTKAEATPSRYLQPGIFLSKPETKFIPQQNWKATAARRTIWLPPRPGFSPGRTTRQHPLRPKKRKCIHTKRIPSDHNYAAMRKENRRKRNPRSRWDFLSPPVEGTKTQASRVEIIYRRPLAIHFATG